ncbi:MAG: GrdX protein [Ruminococcaceae bacterium]|nr:GrdX protein [Oscillospiraceae bacterium]
MYLIVTNNPMAARRFTGRGEVRLREEDTYRDVLVRARDLVYIGHRLCNHPLYGSLRPHETPYRTVVLSAEAGAPDWEECCIFSDALTVTDKFTLPDRTRMAPSVLLDYQMIDCDLVENVFSDR